MEKNVAGKWIVFAYGLPDHANPGEAITGDAANITANIRIDGGAANAVDDTNPAELEDGYYVFDITAVEANGDNLLLAPASGTANVQVIAVPGAVWTRPPNFNDLGIETDGDLTKVNLCASNTDMRGTDSANTVVPDAAGVAPTAVEIRTEMDSNSTQLAKIGTIPALDGAAQTIGAAIGKLADDNAGADFDATNHSQKAIIDRGDAAWITGAGGTPPDLLQSTTIATLASQISFTLTAGSADDGAYGDNGAHMAICVITDQTTAEQKCIGTITNYVGATKTVTLVRDPGVFTVAVGDSIDIIAGATSSSVADEKYIGSTHAVIDSHARRLRNLQEFGSYQDDSVWIDTIGGTAGTTDYESGTILNKVDSIADANTIGISLGIPGRTIIPGSSITLAASQENQNFRGNLWTLALGGQSISASHIYGATISGICTGVSPPEFHECEVNAVTVPPCTFHWCDMAGAVTLPVGNVHMHRCSGDGSTFDFGAAVANTTLHMSHFSGETTINNLGASGTDILNLRGHGKITLDASCVGGTINWDGHFTFVNNGSGITFNADDISTNVDTILTDLIDGGRLDLIFDAILLDTGTSLVSQIAGLNNISSANVLTQVNAALDTAISELSVGVPAAEPSIRNAVMLLYMALRNKLDVQTSGTDSLEVHNDAGTKITEKLVTDDGTDYSEAKMT